MSKLTQHVDEMSGILTQTTKYEQSLVKALGDALRQVDDHLVQNIRNLNTQHQARRAEIFLELQALASSIGLFPTMQEIPHAPPANDALARAQFIPVGDWRQAAQNIHYQDELDFHRTTVGRQQ
jgi:uncharacterized protein YPO0396